MQFYRIVARTETSKIIPHNFQLGEIVHRINNETKEGFPNDRFEYRSPETDSEWWCCIEDVEPIQLPTYRILSRDGSIVGHGFDKDEIVVRLTPEVSPSRGCYRLYSATKKMFQWIYPSDVSEILEPSTLNSTTSFNSSNFFTQLNLTPQLNLI